MSSTVTPTLKPSNRLWGIYYTDPEYAREMGDPLRTVVEAPTKLVAEKAAARLGFDNPWAHPVTYEEIQHARWLPLRAKSQRQTFARKTSRGVHI